MRNSNVRLATYAYDAIGNPLTYYNGSSYTFTWTGRELATATKGSGSVISYEYNASGMRTSKTVGGAKTLYFYDGDRLVGEMNTSYITVYLYSPDGGVVGMQVRSLSSSSSAWSTYWYEKNLQGDIVAIYGDNGTKYVTYRYDAWGNHTTTYYNGGSSIVPVANNPIRYRGYYYDTDLSLYYLGSRYYDPAICRFINMDAIGVISATPMALTDKNLYAYCDNNPVMRVDYGGYAWETIFDVLSLGASIMEVAFNPADPFAWLGLAGDAVDLIPFVTGVGETIRTLKTTSKIVDGVDDTIDTYRNVRKITKGTGLEAHHIVEKRFAVRKIIDANTNDILSIGLTKSKHQFYTQEWRKLLPYGSVYSKKEILESAISIYGNDYRMLGTAIFTITK